MTQHPNAPQCHGCGALAQPEHRFCGVCGAALPDAPASPEASPEVQAELHRLAGPAYEAPAPPADTPALPPTATGSLPWFIPPNRVVLLAVLSSGLYLFYWMYLTWRHYRDHTREEAFPVLHALCLLVPVYQFFRLHAHLRVYQELMQQRGVPDTLSPLRSVGLFLLASLLFTVAWRLLVEIQVDPADSTNLEQLGFFAVSAARVAILAWITWQAQRNINRYWQHRMGMSLVAAPLSVVELALVILGIINWIGWVLIMVNPEILLSPPQSEALPGQ